MLIQRNSSLPPLSSSCPTLTLVPYHWHEISSGFPSEELFLRLGLGRDSGPDVKQDWDSP